MQCIRKQDFGPQLSIDKCGLRGLCVLRSWN